MKSGLGDIIGKTISNVVVSKSNRDPIHQVFLIFSDGTSLELYGKSFNCASGLDPGGVEEAIKYIGKSGDPVIKVYPEHELEETVRDRFLRNVMEKAVEQTNKKLPPGEKPLVWPKKEDLLEEDRQEK